MNGKHFHLPPAICGQANDFNDPDWETSFPELSVSTLQHRGGESVGTYFTVPQVFSTKQFSLFVAWMNLLGEDNFKYLDDEMFSNN